MATVNEVVNYVIATDSVLNARVKAGDLGQVGAQILAEGEDELKNRFLNCLINKVAKTEIKSRIFQNPLTRLKKTGTLYGRFVENVHINSVKGKDYDRTGSSLLSVTDLEPDVVTEYYSKRREKKYETVIYDTDLKQAFTSEVAFMNLYNRAVAELSSGDAIEEYITMKATIGDAVAKGKMKTVTLDGGVELNAGLGEEIVWKLMNLGDSFSLPSTQFNSFNIANPESQGSRECFVPKSEQIIIMRNDVKNTINLKLLARMYNDDYAKLEQNTLYVDEFTGAPNCQCIIADNNWLDVEDLLLETRHFTNPDGLWTKYFLHHHQRIGLSNLVNAVAIVTPTE